MIEFACSCGKTLAVGDELAGRRARCPACGSIRDVPGGGPAAFPGAPRAESAGPGAGKAPPPPPFEKPAHAAPPPAASWSPAGAIPLVGEPTVGRETNVLSLVGLGLGLAGCACPVAPIGFILAFLGWRQAVAPQPRHSGAGLGIAGMALNGVWMLIWLGILAASILAPVTPPAPHAQPDRPVVSGGEGTCADNLRNLWVVLDTYQAEKRQVPPGSGARFLAALEAYGRDRFPRLAFSIRAPGNAHPTRTAYRGPARTRDLRPDSPLIADWDDEHPGGVLHVLFADGSIRTLQAGSPEHAAALEGTQ